MGTSRQDNKRCETCRFWDAGTSECHRRAPVVVPSLGLGAGDSHAPTPAANSAWPRTRPDEWCGEWDTPTEGASVGKSAVPICQDVAAQTFIGRVASSLQTPDSATLLEALLNQLSPDVRRVIVRVNGLDGLPLSGLKEVARDFRMSRDQVRALIAAGEKRLAEVVGQLVARRHDKRQ